LIEDAEQSAFSFSAAVCRCVIVDRIAERIVEFIGGLLGGETGGEVLLELLVLGNADAARVIVGALIVTHE
jgi:hypothetical protein